MVFKNSKGLDWTYTIEEMAVHPDFSPSNRNQQNDIAVATLTKDVQLSEYTQPICLPPSGNSADNYVGQRLEVAGFPLPKRNKEKTESSEPDRFLKVQAQVANEDHCKAKFGAQFSLTPKQICGYVSGDENLMSGAPLMALTVVDDKPQNIYLVGIISFGLSIKSTEYPDVFTRILPYKDWIQRNAS
ncbi:CLIP domain-containing serine protease HP8-like [Drosophila tropicalis]|uniref:CLIP domain-containing serine protease HP8-like n=1 Tax=Drosophila tropicalis TaxID=46794 RepID=UPI0035ABAA84